MSYFCSALSILLISLDEKSIPELSIICFSEAKGGCFELSVVSINGAIGSNSENSSSEFSLSSVIGGFSFNGFIINFGTKDNAVFISSLKRKQSSLFIVVNGVGE